MMILALRSSAVQIFEKPEEMAAHQWQSEGERRVVVQKCCNAFVQIFLPLEGIQGWVRKEDLPFFSSPHLDLGIQKQHVVRLDGACSSGKSSFEETLRKKGNWVVLDDDKVSYEVMKEALKAKFPSKYPIIAEGIEDSNLYPAFTRNLICFKREIPEEKKAEILERLTEIRKELDDPSATQWRRGVWQSVGERMVAGVRRAIAEQKNVLVSASSAALKKIDEEYPHTKIMSVLIYNTPRVAFEKLMERNAAAERDGDYEGIRFSSWVLQSYCRLMKLAKTPSVACDSVPRQDLSELFDRVISNLKHIRPPELSSSFTQFDHSEILLRSWQRELFLPLEVGQETCYIEPKEAYDLILRSDKGSAEELAQSFLEILSP